MPRSKDRGIVLLWHARDVRLRGERIIVAALLSAKDDAEARIAEASELLRRAGAEVVGTLLQRRGVSRAKGPGGARRMSEPMDRKTVLGSGKTEELSALCRSRAASWVIFLNQLEPSQVAALARATGVRVGDLRDAG